MNEKLKLNYQKLKESLFEIFGNTIFHDVFALVTASICLIILLALALIIMFQVKPADYLIPLVYNSTYGVTALGSWVKVYYYPLAYAGFLLLNILIAWAFFEKERLISYLILFVSVLAGIYFVIIEYNLTILIRG